MSRPRTVTLEAVARQAGVSLKTASNAVNGTGRMAPETRERILAVVRDLGYRVNVSARNLTRGRTGVVTLAVPTLKAAYLGELAEAVIEAARRHDLVVYVTTYPDDGDGGCRTYLQQFNSQLSDGLLLSLPEQEHLTDADLDVAFPLVGLGSRSTFGRADRVATDDIVDGRTAAAHLYDSGCRHLAVVGAHSAFDPAAIGAAREGNAELRLRGVAEAAAERGRALDPRLVGVTAYDWTIGSGFRATQAIIDTGIPFDGLVCLNDGLAIGAISAVRAHGLDVPGDVQVIGFDNIDESAYLSPPLTTMDAQVGWIAEHALDRLVARIERPADSAGPAPEDDLAPSRLVIRATTR